MTSKLSSRSGWLYAAAALLCVALGLGLAHDARAALVVYSGVGLIALAALRPAWFVTMMIATLLVPYAWSPNVIGSGPTPPLVLVALPGALVAAVRLLDGGTVRFTGIDWLVLAFIGSVGTAEFATGHGHQLSLHMIKTGLVPYVAFRAIFTAWPGLLPRLAELLVWLGVALSALALWEVLRGGNPFYGSRVNENLAIWAIDIHRGGVIRAAATFGHPIALGSMLVVPLLITFAQRRWWLFAIVAMGEVLTFSRGPWIAAVLTIALYATLTHGVQRLLLVGTALAVAAMFVGPARNVVSSSFQAGTSEQANADYRSQLVGSTLSSLTLWGDPQSPGTTTAVSDTFQATDITSEFALVGRRQGVLGLAVWVMLPGVLIAVALSARRAGGSLLLVLALAGMGMWISMLSVALITTFAAVFWLILAATAAAVQLLRSQQFHW